MAAIASNRTFRFTLLAIVVIASLIFVYALRAIFAPVILGFLIAYVVDPLASFLQKRGLSRLLAVIVIYVVVSLVVLGILAFGSMQIVRGVETGIEKLRGERLLAEGVAPSDYPGLEPGADFEDRDGDGAYDPGYLRQAWNWLGRTLDAEWAQSARSWLEAEYDQLLQKLEDDEQRQQLIERAAKWTGAFLLRPAAEPGTGTGTTVRSTGAGAGGEGRIFMLLSWLVFCPLYVFFFLLEFDAMVSAIRSRLPGRYRPRIENIFSQIDDTLAAFFRGRLTVCLVKGIITAVALFFLGVPFSLFIGLAAGFLGLIPYVGIYFAIIPAVLLTWFEYQGVGRVLGVLVSFGVIEVLEGFVLIPRFLGKEVGLHPVTIIVTLLIFAKLLGLVGVLLSVPLAAICKILGREFILPLVDEFAAEKPDSARSPPGG